MLDHPTITSRDSGNLLVADIGPYRSPKGQLPGTLRPVLRFGACPWRGVGVRACPMEDTGCAESRGEV